MKVDSLLRAHLEPLWRRRHYVQLWRTLAGVWAVAALIALIFLGLQKVVGWSSVFSLPLSVLIGLVLAAVALLRSRRSEPDWRAIALEVEAAHPELQGRLITAVQQDTNTSVELHYLQQRVIEEALTNSRSWGAAVPPSQVAFAQAMQFCTLALFGLVLWQLRVPAGHGMFVPAEELRLTVTPGDTTLERGSSLVVAAQFKGVLPPRVELVYGHSGSTNSRFELVRSLADPLFGGTVQRVDKDLLYHLEYGGKRTRDYKITVFDYPRLERADADLRYPEYTGLAPRRIENTRRISAVEGSRVQLHLQLNKAVAQASLVSGDTNRNALRLAIDTNRPSATLDNFLLAASKTYELHLTDFEGRTNKLPAQFVFDALKNRTPELKVTSPRGDTRPSPLEELSFEGTVYDDFGVQAFGLASAVVGKEIKMIELGQHVPGKEKRPFQFLLRIEELGLKTDDLMSWFVWADDIGPDGKVRRTTGDLYFAEVRPFEEIFRESQSMSAAAQQQQQQSGQGGGQTEKLAELQKQIINATWKLFRQSGHSLQSTPPKSQTDENKQSSDPSNRNSSLAPKESNLGAASRISQIFAQPARENPPSSSGARPPAPRPPRSKKEPELAGDMEVVRSAQERALEQAAEAGQNRQDPHSAGLWEAVTRQMERAVEKLRNATNSPAEFQEALAAEQAAYQALLKLQEREYSVSRRQSRQRGQSGRQQQMQRQLDQLDLAREENRYETERQAQPPQSAERSEQLQVMNRLQELARRQQDLNERLKEMQTALQEVRTEAEREEIRRELKRLQEEQQELLADADEVRQRMDRPENQSRMNEQRRQMEQARNELQRAAEAAQQGQTSQALASGTRAQRQLQQMRDDMRRQNASEFEDELRQMRTDARELAHRQEELQKKMEALSNPSRRSLSDADLNKEALDELAGQRERLTNLVDHATQLSRETEEAEPLVSRELYETLRRFSQNETSTSKQFQEEFLNRPSTPRSLYERLKQTTEQSGAKSLDLTSEMLRLGLVNDANLAEDRARAGIDDLRRGVERAAQSVLGDDAQSLRLAREELEHLTEQLQKEIARADTGRTNGPQGSPQAGNPTDNERQRVGAREAGQDNQSASNERQRNGNQANPDQARAGAEARQQTGPQEQPSQGASRNPQPAGSEGAGGQRPPRPPPQGDGTPPGNLANQQQQTGSSNEPSPGQPNATGNPQRGANRSQSAQNSGGGGNRWSLDLDRLLEGRGGYGGGPITGEDFAPWSDRLREVEELVDTPSLRTEVARARERARQVRQDFKRNQQKPDWATVRLQVLKPLVEVRDRISEELARREPQENLVPIDRDPVPGRYSELVRRYYERLGKANAEGAPTQSKPEN